MADRVTIRNQHGHEREVSKTAVPFFVSQGYVVLDAAGRVNPKATSATTTNKESN